MRSIDLEAKAAPLISMVIPVYNGASYIVAHLRNFLMQDYSHFEIIVVDDGSDDDTVAQITAQVPDPRVRVIRNVHGGMSVGRNRGVEESAGSLITFVDADDYIAPWYLSRLAAPLLADPAVQVTMAPYVLTAEDHLPALQDSAASTMIDAATALQTILCQVDGHDVNVTSKMYRRTLVKENRFVPGLVFEDFELSLRLLTTLPAATPIALVQAQCYAYVQRAGSIMHRRFTDAEFTSTMHILATYGAVFAALPSVLNQAYQTKVISTVAGVYSRAVLDHHSRVQQDKLAEALNGLVRGYRTSEVSTRKTRAIVMLWRLGVVGQRCVLPMIYRLSKRVR